MAEKSIYASGKPVHSDALVTEFLSNGATIAAVGDYSGETVEQFKITCAQGSRKLHINRMIVYVEDVGNFASDKYGYNVVLTNGINVCTRDASDALIKNLTSQATVKTNAQWGAYCYDVAYSNWGSGNDSLAVRWTFGNTGKLVTLEPTEYLTAELNDDYTDLVAHTFMVQGYYQ